MPAHPAPAAPLPAPPLHAIGAALTGDAHMQSQAEFRRAALLLATVVLMIVAVALLVWMFGLPALGLAGLLGTALMFLVLIAYAAGW